jgi:hypothetical protein
MGRADFGLVREWAGLRLCCAWAGLLWAIAVLGMGGLALFGLG